MTVSVESHISECGAPEGVKFEEMVRITKAGCELLAKFPFEDELLHQSPWHGKAGRLGLPAVAGDLCR